MTDTNSPNRGYLLQETGGNAGLWGQNLNLSVFSVIDRNFGGRLNVDVSGSADVTISSTDAQNRRLNLSGLLTGDINLVLPATQGAIYNIYNGSTGAFTVTAILPTGTGTIIPQGATLEVFANPDEPSVTPTTNLLPVSQGGTGASTGAQALTNLGAASLADPNTWTGAQTFNAAVAINALLTLARTGAALLLSGSTDTAGSAINLISTDGGAIAGPVLSLLRLSGSPAAADILGGLDLYGNNSTPTQTLMARLAAVLDDPTAATASAHLALSTLVNNSFGARANIGAGLWMTGATGTDKGVGTVNATAFYKNGAALPFMTSYDSGFQSVSAGAANTFAHGLGAKPTNLWFEVKTTTTVGGWPSGTTWYVNEGGLKAASSGGENSVQTDATNITLNAQTGFFYGCTSTFGNGSVVAWSNFQIRVLAQLIQ